MGSAMVWVAISGVLLLPGCGTGTDAGTGSGTGDAPEPRGVQLDLPTSSWEPGDDMMFALMGGVVKVDGRGCVFFNVGDGVRAWPVWPEGFTAYQSGGRVTLYDSTGKVVAREGDAVESGGGYVPLDHITIEETTRASACLPEEGEIAAMQGDVHVVSEQ